MSLITWFILDVEKNSLHGHPAYGQKYTGIKKEIRWK